MKKELIRSLLAINQATTGMMMSRHHHEQLSLRSTTVSLFDRPNKIFLQKFKSSLDGFDTIK
jgi:hypothetical protein